MISNALHDAATPPSCHPLATPQSLSWRIHNSIFHAFPRSRHLLRRPICWVAFCLGQCFCDYVGSVPSRLGLLWSWSDKRIMDSLPLSWTNALFAPLSDYGGSFLLSWRRERIPFCCSLAWGSCVIAGLLIKKLRFMASFGFYLKYIRYVRLQIIQS